MAPKTLRFEPLAEHFIDQVAAIEKVVHSAPWSERSFRNELSNQQSIFLVAIEGVNVVGYAGGWTVVDEFHFTNVAVSPEFRRKGTGRELVKRILELAKQAGMLCATLEVRIGNEPAIQLYANLGFERVAVRKKYYPDNHEDAVIMWLYGLQDWVPPK